MKKYGFPLAVAALLAMASISWAKPLVGEVLPDFALKGELDDQGVAQLGGDPNAGSMKLSQVKGEYLLIEFFSMYCPYCQAEAPEVNRLHALLRDAGLGEKVAMLGIGIGNSQFEVDYFKKKFSAVIPLLPDLDFSIHKKIGQVGTPYFVLVKKQDGQLRILMVQEGRMPGVESFLERIKKVVEQ